MAAAVSNLNTTRVLRTIWLNRRISRVDISKRLGLNKSTVSKIVSDLVELGIVEETSQGQASPVGGRRPIHLQIRSDWGCVMGVEIQTEAFTVVGIDLDGDVFFSHSEPLDIRITNLVDSFVTIVQRFKPAIESTGMNLIGIGVGLPGFVDPVKGELLASMPLGLFDPIPFVDLSRKRLGFDIPILVDNDANCGCWGELAFRHTERPENFMFVLGEQRKHTVEMDDYRIMALGLGLVLNGRVHHGHEFSAGEFRSVLYRPGQINQFSIADDQARLFLQDHGVNESIADELARHISFLVHTLNLGKVVIGGPIEVLSDMLIPRVETHIDNNWAYPSKVKCDIAVSRLGEQAVAFGAAGMFLEHLITFPDMAADRERSIYGVDLLRFMIKGRAGGNQ